MAMASPPRCPPLFIRKRELTEVIGSPSVPVQVCIVEGAPMGSGGDATPCKVTREDRRLYFLMCRVSFKAHSHTAFKDGPPSTQFSRMVRHPHSYWMYCHPHEAHSHTALKDVPSSTRDPRTALGGSCDHALGHRPHERQGADPRTAPFEGTPYAKALFNLDVGDELFEIVRRAGRLRAFADLTVRRRSAVGCTGWYSVLPSILFPPPTLFPQSLLPCGFVLIRFQPIWS